MKKDQEDGAYGDIAKLKSLLEKYGVSKILIMRALGGGGPDFPDTDFTPEDEKEIREALLRVYERLADDSR